MRLIVNRIFNQVSDQLVPASSASANDIDSAHINSSHLHHNSNDVVNLDSDDEELGYIEIQEKLGVVAAQQGEFIAGWTSLMQSNTALTSDVLDNLNTLGALGNINPASVNSNMRRVADSFDAISDYLSDGLPAYVERNDDIVKLLTSAIDIARDFEGSGQVEKIKNDAIELREGVESNYVSTVNLNEQIQSVPRLSGIFNKSRKRIMRVHDRLINENRRLESLLDQIIEL